MENASLLESHEVLGEVMQKEREKKRKEEEERPRREREERKEWYVKNLQWLLSYAIPGLILAFLFYCISFIIPIPESPQQQAIKQLMDCVGKTLLPNMTELVVPIHRCNSEKIDTLDLSLFRQLKRIEISDECFENVKEVKLTGLNQLESVAIGEKCFTKFKYSWGYNQDRHFHLKDCERLRELKIGRFSFSDYSECEIDNVPSLEVIEMGVLNERSYNFYYASLELKSEIDGMK